jgi:hypothetical protein
LTFALACTYNERHFEPVFSRLEPILRAEEKMTEAVLLCLIAERLLEGFAAAERRVYCYYRKAAG